LAKKKKEGRRTEQIKGRLGRKRRKKRKKDISKGKRFYDTRQLNSQCSSHAYGETITDGEKEDQYEK